jgi:hypothetical protein
MQTFGARQSARFRATETAPLVAQLAHSASAVPVAPLKLAVLVAERGARS